jgi:hypothetical protein
MKKSLFRSLINLKLVNISSLVLFLSIVSSHPAFGNPVRLADQIALLEGQKIRYSGPFTNTTYRKAGNVAIEILFERDNRISGYINFTNNPNGQPLCGAGNFRGIRQGNRIQLRFVSDDPDPGCGWDRNRLIFLVNATLSSDGSRLESGTYIINNSQGGGFQANALNLPASNFSLPQPAPLPAPTPVARPQTAPPPANTPVAANTAPVNVYNIANQTTVRIDGQSPGSGVIIARSGNTYYILTAKHVVATPDEYMVVTPNGKKFKIDYSQVKKFTNLDLAVVQFTSSENFMVAQLGSSEQIKQGDNIFVSGWPIIDGSSNQQVTPGQITGFRTGDANGYELTYSNPTGGGMSGGPVFNAKGQVIGIHGRGGGNQEVGKIGINLGMPIHLFLRQAPQAGLNIQQLGLRTQS